MMVIITLEISELLTIKNLIDMTITLNSSSADEDNSEFITEIQTLKGKIYLNCCVRNQFFVNQAF